MHKSFVYLHTKTLNETILIPVVVVISDYKIVNYTADHTNITRKLELTIGTEHWYDTGLCFGLAAMHLNTETWHETQVK